jgi:hypothetical protein
MEVQQGGQRGWRGYMPGLVVTSPRLLSSQSDLFSAPNNGRHSATLPTFDAPPFNFHLIFEIVLCQSLHGVLGFRDF